MISCLKINFFSAEVVQNGAQEEDERTEEFFDENGVPTCVLCDKTFKQLDYLKKHYKNVHKPEELPKEHKCFKCNSSYPSINGLSTHVKKDHNNTNTRKRPHETISTNSPSTSGNIKDAYKCCSSLIKNLDDMFKHIEVKHPTEISSKWIKCDKCDEHFWSTRLVDCHSLLQHKVQRYR